jgi:hypothetical protein
MVKNSRRSIYDFIDKFKETEGQYYYSGQGAGGQHRNEKSTLKAPDAIGGGIIGGNTHGAALETVLNLITIYASAHFDKPQKSYYIETDEFSTPKPTGFTLTAKDMLAYVTFLTKYRRQEGNDTKMTTSGDFLIQHLGFAKVGGSYDLNSKNNGKYITTVAKNLSELDRYWRLGYIPYIVPSYGFDLSSDLVPSFSNNDMTIGELVNTLQGTKLSESVKDKVLETYLRDNPINFSEYKNHQDFYKLRSKLNLPTKQQDLIAHEYEKTTNKKMLFYDRLFEKAATEGDKPNGTEKA